MGKLRDLMDRELRIRGLAENTRRSYLEKMRRFVRPFMRQPDQLTAEDVKQHQLFLADVGIAARFSSASPDHSRILIRVSPDAAKDKGEIRLLFNWAEAIEWTPRAGASQ